MSRVRRGRQVLLLAALSLTLSPGDAFAQGRDASGRKIAFAVAGPLLLLAIAAAVWLWARRRRRPQALRRSDVPHIDTAGFVPTYGRRRREPATERASKASGRKPAGGRSTAKKAKRKTKTKKREG